MELSCDEVVMQRMGSDIRRDYANSLLRLATRGRLISATPLAFGEGDTKRRVRNVIAYKKPVVWVTVAAVILVICVGVGLLFNAEEDVQIASEPTEIASVVVSDDIITANLDPSGTIVQTATQFVNEQVAYYNEIGAESDFTIISAEIVGLENMNIGTATETLAITLYKVEYRLTPDDIDNVPLSQGLSIDNGAITEWGSTGQPYLLFYQLDGDGQDEILIEITNTDAIFAGYGSDELLAEYGTAYRAYCMERYAEYVSTSEDRYAQALQGYTLEQAISDGAFVYDNDGIISGREHLDAFEEASSNREDDTLRTVYQYTPDGAETPVLSVTDIVYENALFTVTCYPSTAQETQFVRTYQYLVTETAPPMTNIATYDKCHAYYLVNDPAVTYQDIINGLLSSQYGAAEDAHVLFVEYLS